MPVSPSLAKRSSVENALARDRLGWPLIAAAIASSVAPLTVMAVIVPVAVGQTGLVGFPVAMIIITALLALFAIGYLTMARHIENAGAFYAYIAQGLGRPLGVGVAWFAVVVYNCFQLCAYGAFGALAGPVLSDVIGLPVAWWVPAIVAWAIVAGLGANEIQLAGYVLMVLVAAETVLVVLFSIATMLAPGFAFSGAAMDIGGLSGPMLGVFVVLGATSFAGYEQSVVYIEESRNRRRTIPVATYVTLAVIGAVYVFASWVQISAPGTQIIDRAGEEGQDLLFNEAAVVLGHWALIGGKFLLGTGLIAAAIAFHNAITRYTYSLGREGVVPRLFGRTTAAGAPRNASLAQTVFALGVIVLYGIAGWDPLIHMFYWLSTTGGLGVLLLYTATSIAVVCFFVRDKRGENLWRRLIAPSLAAGLLLGVSWLAVVNLAALYGVEPGTGPSRVAPIALAATVALGTLWALILKRTKPEVYQGIGRGARSTPAGDSGLASVLAPKG